MGPEKYGLCVNTIYKCLVTSAKRHWRDVTNSLSSSQSQTFSTRL